MSRSKFDPLDTKSSVRSTAPKTYNDGRTDERARIAAIMDSEDAVRRPALARKLALETNLDSTQATSVLAAAPVESDPFLEAMANHRIGLTAGHTAGPGGLVDPRAERAAEIRATAQAINRARGYTGDRS